MGYIKDIKHTLGTIYGRYSDNGELINRAGVIGFCKLYKGKYYFILTDINGKRITEANEYLNIELGNEFFKKRELAYTALKIFYSYIFLFNVERYEVGIKNKRDLRRLLSFLEGGFQRGSNWDLFLTTSRSNNTINNYLNVYRDFYSSIFSIEDSLLHQTRVITKYSGGGTLGHANKKALEKYDVNRKVEISKKTPKYIKWDQYKQIVSLIEEKYSSRELLIVILMFEYGLRIGEVLGITIEDIQEGNEGISNVILRNRLTDKPYQSAKSVMNIKNPSDYYKKSYGVENVGYQIIKIDEDTMNIFQTYLDEIFDEFLLNKSIKKRENLNHFAKADLVNTNEFISENYYVFLNKQNYAPLTQGGWNYVCRNIFEEVGISIDGDLKENNLSHRFRHGFAMLRAKNGWSELKLSEALRHKSIANVKKYYNPDEEDTVRLLKEQRDFFKKRGSNFDN